MLSICWRAGDAANALSRAVRGNDKADNNGVKAVRKSNWIAACLTGTKGWGGDALLRLTAIAALLAALLAQWAQAQDNPPLTLNSDVPVTYTVQSGDTLWDIATVYLRDPWRWEELWAGNPQIDNPHLIFPGDTLTLVWQDGQPRLVKASQGDIKLSPQMRPSPLDLAIPAIPREQIDPFIRNHQVVAANVLEQSGYVVSGDAGRLISGVGDLIYSKGSWQDERDYRLVRRVEKLTDPESGEGLGIFVVDVGEARLRDPDAAEGLAAMTVTEMREEIRIGDRLLPVEEASVRASIQPQPPQTSVDGATMIAVAGGVTQIGVLDIVVVNRGARESLRVGDVLVIDQTGQAVNDPMTGKAVQLPDIRAGVLMVFAVYERASFGLVLEASRPLSVGDKLRNP